MTQRFLIPFLIFTLLLSTGSGLSLFAQSKLIPSDTTRLVEILGSRDYKFVKKDSATQLSILVGNVRMKQGNTLFYCDSCVMNDRENLFEAFGNVHIKDGDTTDVYSDYLRYLTDKKLAYLKGKVKLTDGKGELTTPELEYDLNTHIGNYNNGGKLVNEKTTLTSQQGYYYSEFKDAYFKGNVVVVDPASRVESDSLLYNTENRTVRFISETLITDTSNRTIRTREGFYNLANGKGEFGQNTIIRDGATTITGGKIINDDSTGIAIIERNGVIRDTAQGFILIGDRIFRNNKNESLLATKKPLMIVKQDEDSIYITADTLFSARLSDLRRAPDTTQQREAGDSLQIASSDSLTAPADSTALLVDTPRVPVADSLVTDTLQGTVVLDAGKKDSTNRYFEAYRNVRIFSDSMQAVSDSMFYSFRDSVFRLYQSPVVWSKDSQITGDTILLHTKNKKPDWMEVFENSLLVNMVEPDIFNQIRGTRMDGYFIDGEIDSVRVRGSAESIYYLQDEDSAYTGVNQTTADVLDVYFKNRELQKVVFRSEVKGTLWPIQQKTPQEMRVRNFQWLDDRRPKTKFDLFQ